VWEWCLNKYSPPYDIVVDTTDESRVLRGGSFLGTREYAASSVRGSPPPHGAGHRGGFRVGLSPPL